MTYILKKWQSISELWPTYGTKDIWQSISESEWTMTYLYIEQMTVYQWVNYDLYMEQMIVYIQVNYDLYMWPINGTDNII